MKRIVAISAVLTASFLVSCNKVDSPSPTSAQQPAAGMAGPETSPVGTRTEQAPKAPVGSKLVQAPVGEGAATAFRLTNGQTLRGNYVSDRDATLLGFGVRIGNSRGSSDGSLELSICEADACQKASIPLKGTIDNGYAIFTLPTPLEVKNGRTYTYSLKRSMDATNSLAIWLHPAPANASTVVDAGGKDTGRVAKLGLYFKE
ncbi:hypothetical protein [Pseudoxanthomonas wuyuanensis]|uniref:Lipoprotein n=1 Tax=Pseudoxanthomonas wuyuanensis TaxID=1073196 RepID=A0A286D6Y1_9GAMM|nr:hypothetical protein [Pseudoxanthomonas wuyuanensis]SOD54387.1 hypothetical protein SAMN06296416_103312 [Pseudoxanthomonas wuyuanensis]